MLREVQQGQFDTIAEEAPFVFEHAYQTVAMVRRFSHIAGAGSVGTPLLEPTWGEASRRTMAVLDACFASIGRGGTAVPVAALAPAQPTPPPPPPKRESHQVLSLLALVVRESRVPLCVQRNSRPRPR